MTFEEVLNQTIALLQRQGRVSYRALKRQFDLDEAYVEDVKLELIEVHQVAVDQDNTMLVWTGGVAAPPLPAAAPAADRVRQPDTAPLTYTPPHLTDKILAARPALEGERKQVTVFFADIKDSTRLIEGLDPEAAQQLLDPVIRLMMAAVHRFEGTVNQVLGDGIMALFGAPIAHEDHALRACYAALALQSAIRPYADEVRRAQGMVLQLRVGLNSGEVVVRAIGNDLHMDYSAVGQHTHLAARMEQLATPGTILLTAATWRLVEGLVRVKALGAVPVKGLTAPVEAFELVGVTALRRRLQAAAARGLTRFVGRQHELEALHQALAQAAAGHGQVAALVGEAGVGKSRLAYEFVHAHPTQGWLVLESASVSYGKATPYFPVLDLLRRYCHLEEQDDPRTVRAKVTGQVLTLDEALQDTLPALLSLLEVLPDDSPFRTLDPPQRRQRTLQALKRVLLRESQVQPLLLVFEDLHWIDAETQALLDSLVESLPTAQLLLLVNYRPEYQHGWGSKTYYTQLRLDPLPPASADEFLQALLGDDPSLAPLKQLLIARTEGNPFFLEESVRTLVETGVLVGEPGAYRLAQALPTIQVPATVQAVLAARIDRLPPEEKRLLQTAAVIGTEVPLPLLQAIADLPEAALHRGLAHLQAAEFLYETRLFPEPEYTFKHALTHEVAYGSLLLERRRVLHARLVEALEALAPERGAEQVERLAHHALRGEVWDKAVTYCQQAGARAYDRAAFREAVAAFEQALQALAHLPEHGDTRGLAIDLRLALGAPAERTGRVWAAPRPVGRGRGPGPGARRSGPAGTGAGQDGQCTQDNGRPRRRHGGGPAGPRARGRARRQRLAGASILSPGAGIPCHRRLRPGGRAAAAERGGGGQGVWHAQYRRADPVPGVAGADLERARGLRRGPAPRGGGAPPRHAGRPRDRHRSLPTAASATCTSPKGTWSTPSGCWTRAWPSVVPPATGTGCDRSRRAWAMPLRSRGASRRGARCWRRRSAKVSARARWQIMPTGSHGSARSVVWRDAARRPGSTPARRSTWPGSTRNAGTRRSRCTSLASSRPTPIPPMPRRPKPTTSRPWPWPRNSACARSWPTATTGWAGCTARPAVVSRPAPPCLPPSTSTAPWT